jgi:hypothetical protein
MGFGSTQSPRLSALARAPPLGRTPRAPAASAHAERASRATPSPSELQARLQPSALDLSVALRPIDRRFSLYAACVWLFSVSLTYHLYILFRDGEYPNAWLPNIPASSCLYVCAGLMWSLESRPRRGLVFAFTEPAWFITNAKTTFLTVAPIVLVLMAMAITMIGSFLL